MKILQVITSLRTGGAEHVVVQLALRLQTQGHEVDVVTFDGTDTPYKKMLVEGGVKVICFSRKHANAYNPLYVFRLARMMRKYDVVHTHNTTPQLYAALANMFCRTKLVTTEHSTNNRRRMWKGYGFIDRWMYRQYNEVVCISDIAKKTLEKYLGGCQTSTIVINNGVDVGRFHSAQELQGVKAEGDFAIVMIAGFRDSKDQDTLIKSMALLPQNYKLWLVGVGVRESKLLALVKELHIEDRVKFWGLRMDVPEILKSADVVVMSSHWEGLSLSNLEGMSAGKPFVASDVNGLREVTTGAGILFPHQDAKALAAIIKRLHEDKEYYKHTAEACYQRALKYDINKMIRRYEQEYQKLIKNKDE